MKKVIVFASIIILTIAVVGLAVIGISHIINTNQNNLNEMLDILADTISKYSNNEIIELKGTYGKLNGNGNGIRYFGAALVDKNAIDNPDGLIAELDSKFEIVGILDQDTNSIDIKYLEHESLSYDSVLEQKKEYLTIFFYQSYYDGSNYLDPRGH